MLVLTIQSIIPPQTEPDPPPYLSTLQDLPSTSTLQPAATSASVQEKTTPSPTSTSGKRDWTQIDHPSYSHSQSQSHSQGLVSLASSYPDISFPPSPSPNQHTSTYFNFTTTNPVHPTHHDADQQGLTLTPTLTALTSPPSTPLRTRLIALSTSLTINFLLPFINGIMLGFGEIFARNLVSWLGWRVPVVGGGRNTGTTLGLGLGGAGGERREERRDDKTQRKL